MCQAAARVARRVAAVIEDAVVGVEAANRAGMFSIAYVAPTRDINLFRQAGRVVAFLGDLSPADIRRAIEQRHDAA